MAARIAILAIGLTSFVLALANAHTYDVKFGYFGEIGPVKWGSLSPDYQLCSNGKQQSPINIVKKDVVVDKQLSSLNVDYSSSNSTLVDNGFNIALLWDGDGGVMNVDGKNYTLKQLHWHSPSEHTIDGNRKIQAAVYHDIGSVSTEGPSRATAIPPKPVCKSPAANTRRQNNLQIPEIASPGKWFPVELHLVHKSDDGNLAVMAVLYKYGDADDFLTQLKDPMDQLTKEVCSGDSDRHVPVGSLDTMNMKKATNKYFRYTGSLTVPPCTENVIWNVLVKVRELTKDQVAALKKPLDSSCKNNARPVQPLNDRKVTMYEKESSR